MKSVHAARFLCLNFAVVCGMVALPAAADTAAPQAPLELTAANLERVLGPPMADWIDKRKGPGAVVVVVRRDGPIFAKGYGFADMAARKPFTADATLVRPGSISKLFTAIAVMQLVDTGQLDLDRDVNGYIDFTIPTPEGGVPVTLRRLLTHRAGFEDHLKGLFSKDREPQPLGRWLAKYLPLRLFPRGDIEAYSNYGFALAGYVVERISGEPFAHYVQRHILDPLGMHHSTFSQPLPDDLTPLMAKGYRTSVAPPLPFFETIVAPAGGLSATAADMGRFVRALMNGGELDGNRILPKARLDEVMAPSHGTPAGYLGLAFHGTKAAGHEAVGHGGETMTFFSDLQFFPEQGVGIFVSRDGNGEIASPHAMGELPNPAALIAARFLPSAKVVNATAAGFSPNDDVAGTYHLSRRAESSWLRLQELQTQSVIATDGAGNARLLAALFPFGDGATFKRVEQNLYEGPSGRRIAFVNDAGSELYIAQPGVRLQRVPWWLDLRWIVPALAISTLIVLLTLFAWPVAVLWRILRKRRWSEDDGDRRNYLTVRLVLIVDAIVIMTTAVVFAIGALDYTIFNDALDPLVLGLYALAWLGVLGVPVAVWAAITFWRNGTGKLWFRIHHSLLAASAAMLAWFFVTFRIAGTTLNY